MKTYIYLHICAIGHWEIVVKRLLDRIKSSGLYDKIDELRFSLLGDYAHLSNDLLQDPKYKNVLWSSDLKLYEACTLNKIWYASREEEPFNVLYLHSKGVTHDPSNTQITNWVEYLTYFNVDRYKDCLEYLKNNDVVGVNISTDTSLHYSGNFWWSKSSYIEKSTQYCKLYCYCAPEYWITMSREGSYVDMCDKSNNLYSDWYTEVYDKTNYKIVPNVTKIYKYTAESLYMYPNNIHTSKIHGKN
jgi:hypothetical protein